MNRNQQVRRVLLITLFLNVLVAIGKIVLGIASGSLAVLADGFHSLTDSAGNVAGLVATSIAARPPDEDHPYGHRRFETLAALLIGGLLLLTAWEMLQGVLERLQTQTLPEISPLLFAVLGATLVMNIGVSRYQIRAGKRLQSEILLADARNTQADVFVTLSVITSTALVAITGMAWLDAVAALLVIGLIAHAAWEIVRQTGSVLVDTAPYTPQELQERLLECCSPMVQVERVRSRGSLDDAHIDLDLRVPAAMTAEHSENLARRIQQHLRETLPGIHEVNIQFVAREENTKDPILVARALADGMGLSTHEVHLAYEGGEGLLELHVEVPAGQTLSAAHEQVSLLEKELVQALPTVGRVVTHIEPRAIEIAAKNGNSHEIADHICTDAQVLLNAQYPQVGWHHFAAHATPQGFALNLHAALPAQITLEAAHELAEAAEATLRGAMPNLTRITIHTEPDEPGSKL